MYACRLSVKCCWIKRNEKKIATLDLEKSIACHKYLNWKKCFYWEARKIRTDDDDDYENDDKYRFEGNKKYTVAMTINRTWLKIVFFSSILFVFKLRKD